MHFLAQSDPACVPTLLVPHFSSATQPVMFWALPMALLSDFFMSSCFMVSDFFMSSCFIVSCASATTPRIRVSASRTSNTRFIEFPLLRRFDSGATAGEFLVKSMWKKQKIFVRHSIVLREVFPETKAAIVIGRGCRRGLLG